MSTVCKTAVGFECDQAEIRAISPAYAKKRLEESENEKFVSRGLHEKYVKEILEKRWARTPIHGITLYRDGTLASGHEFLRAIVRAGVQGNLFVRTIDTFDSEGIEEGESASDAAEESINDSKTVTSLELYCELPNLPEKNGLFVVRDEPGRNMMISKHKLCVTREYQRTMSIAAVLDIIKEFSWQAFGTLLVCVRPDGTFFVYDGGHRLCASMYFDEIDELPCMVFHSSNAKEEAVGFDLTNKHRTKVTPVQSFIANVCGERPYEVWLNEMFSNSGYRVGKGHGKTVSCVTTLLSMAKKNSKALSSIWPVLVDLHDGRPINSQVAGAIFYIETHLPEGVSLSDRRWHDKTVNVGYDGVIQAIAGAKSAGNVGSKANALAILTKINVRLQPQNSLTMN